MYFIKSANVTEEQSLALPVDAQNSAIKANSLLFLIKFWSVKAVV